MPWWLQWVALVVGLLGSLASIIGLPMAYKQIKLAKREATKAADAARLAREKVEEYAGLLGDLDAELEMDRVWESLKVIKSFLREKSYAAAAERLTTVRHRLLDLSGIIPVADRPVPEIFQRQLSRLETIEDSIDSALATRNEQILPTHRQQFGKQITECINELQPMREKLRQRLRSPA